MLLVTTVELVVPVHNSAAGVADRIRQLHTGLPTAWRLRVVDAGSTDGTSTVVACLASDLDRISLVRLEDPVMVRTARTLAATNAVLRTEVAA